MITSNLPLIIVLISISLLLYTFLLYPIFTFILAKIINKRYPEKDNINYEPQISIIISAYNEEKMIYDCIMSLVNSDYPKEKMEILVGSDGSSDRTFEILQELSEKYNYIKPYNFGRTGKNGILNNLCSYARGELFFFMDADCRISKFTISKLIYTLSDENIGAATPTLNSIFAGNNEIDAGAHGEGLYQNYEQRLRINESLIFSTVISLGQFYGIKAKYYSPLPDNNVCDDWMSLMFVAMVKKRIVCLPDAYVFEIREKSLKDELKRRIRITAGALYTVYRGKRLMLPFFGWYSFALWSHRILRYLSPFFILSILIFSFLIPRNNNISSLLLIAQAAFYSLGIVGLLFNKLKIDFKLTKIVTYFLTMILGIFLGYIRIIKRKNISIWTNNK